MKGVAFFYLFFLNKVCFGAGPEVSAQDLTEDEEAVDEDVVDDVTAEDEDDGVEVEDDENTELVSGWASPSGLKQWTEQIWR